MRYRRTIIEVSIRLDPVPGWGHQPEDHVRMLQRELNASIPHYKPEVTLLGVKDEPPEDTERYWKQSQEALK